jgi:ABC-2 type transport system ATP-binding protein
MNPVIDIQNLGHQFGQKVLYKNLNITIDQGQIFGVLGKNGVGKSTLIHILMGYIRPSYGQCLIFGEASHSLTPNIKRKIALLHEGFKAYDFLSIAQYEAFFSAFYPQWKREYFYDLVDLLGCSYDQKLSTLSFGQKSQVVLGALFAQDADLLILDDYSMGLDSGYRRLFIDYLKDHVCQTKKTVLMTSHVMGELVGLIDSMIIIQKGALVYQSTLDGFLERFHCYAFNDENDLAGINIHRIERHKDMNKCFSFDQLRHLSPIECDFEEKYLGFVGKYE